MVVVALGLPMDIRQADSTDLQLCAAVSPASQSTHVWQLRLAYDPVAGQSSEELGATLHRTRLPRQIVINTASAEPLQALWSRAADVLVAADEEQIGGYLVLTFEHSAPIVTVARLVVAPAFRRTGVGGKLIRSAMQWSRAMGFDMLAGHCATRNDPAANFYMRHGFKFAGYSEVFYPRGEIALLWQRAV